MKTETKLFENTKHVTRLSFSQFSLADISFNSLLGSKISLAQGLRLCRSEFEFKTNDNKT